MPSRPCTDRCLSGTGRGPWLTTREPDVQKPACKVILETARAVEFELLHPTLSSHMLEIGPRCYHWGTPGWCFFEEMGHLGWVFASAHPGGCQESRGDACS